MVAQQFAIDGSADAVVASDIRRKVRGRLDEASLDTELTEDILIAVGEALGNAVVHAYRFDDRPGPLSLTMTIDPEHVVIEVLDDGCGMLPRPDSPGLGLGLPVISQLADSCEFGTAASGAGTRVTMTFRRA